MADTVRETFFGMSWSALTDRNTEFGETIRAVGQVSDVKNKTRARHKRTGRNVAAPAESVEEKPGLPIYHCSLEFDIPQTLWHYNSHKNVSFKAH